MEIASFLSDGRKVLIVDDVKTVRTVVKKLLAELGVSAVEEASNGLEALERVKQGGVGLIISDWAMPQMDGLKLINAIREAGVEKIPFIMITAAADRDLVVAAAKEGVDDFVIKPFSAKILEKKITGVLQKSLASPPK